MKMNFKINIFEGRHSFENITLIYKGMCKSPTQYNSDLHNNRKTVKLYLEE